MERVSHQLFMQAQISRIVYHIVYLLHCEGAPHNCIYYATLFTAWERTKQNPKCLLSCVMIQFLRSYARTNTLEYKYNILMLPQLSERARESDHRMHVGFKKSQRRAPIKLPGMHIKVFTCAPWNNTRLGNETDHILRTNSETNFGLFGPRDTFTTPDFLWASLLLYRATLRVDISQVGLRLRGTAFCWRAICMAPAGTNQPFEYICPARPARLFPPVCFGSNTMSLCVARYPNTCQSSHRAYVYICLAILMKRCFPHKTRGWNVKIRPRWMMNSF